MRHLILLIALLVPGLAKAGPIQVTADVPYATEFGHTYDLNFRELFPTEPGYLEVGPGAVFFHGGGICVGTKNHAAARDASRDLAFAGWKVATPNFAQGDDDPPVPIVPSPADNWVNTPPQLCDEAAGAAQVTANLAVEWLAARPDVNPYRLLYAGNSGGAVLALLTAYNDPSHPGLAIADFWGGMWGTAADQIDPGEPPVFIAHGALDPLVPIAQANEIMAAADAAGVEWDSFIDPLGEHGLAIPGPSMDAAFAWAIEQVWRPSNGDGNFDGDVGAADYTLWADSMGQTGLATGDFNHDFVVDSADYTTWANNFGPVPSGPTSIPEPSSGILLLLAIAFFVRRRRGF